MTSDHRYTAQQIESFARAQNCTVNAFKERWIITINGAHFIHGSNGYLPAIRTCDLGASIRRDLSHAPLEKDSEAGIDLIVPGTMKLKSPEAVLREYATVARRLVSSMSIDHSYYDATSQTFYERVCPLRPLTPEYNENIDQWLYLLGGGDENEKNANHFLDWVATATDLKRVTCALYLHAAKDYGKTLFANGIARLWGEMPTEFDSTIGSFNSAILNNPLILADEYLPRNVTSGFIRKFVGSYNRSLKRKGMPESDLLGAVRLIIAANNDNLLRFDDEDFSPDDVTAIAARILYIKCSPKAVDFIKELNGFEGTKDWINGDKIAKHALWLRDNRPVQSGRRFLIEGGVDMLHRRLASNGNIRELAIEWTCRAILRKWVTSKFPGIRFGNGEVYVNASFVQDTWESVTQQKQIPSLIKISRAFKPLCDGKDKRLKIIDAHGERRADFYKIDVSHIYEHCASVTTIEKMKEIIEKETKIDDDTDGSPPTGNGNDLTNGHKNEEIFKIPASENLIFTKNASEAQSLFNRYPPFRA